MRRRFPSIMTGLGLALLVAIVGRVSTGLTLAGEPDPKTYWNIDDVRPGMKGTGKTVMVGTTLEEFQAEVLGVMRDVSPGRDMVLCRLKGCNLEHAGIIQGMSGSPIMIDGKLLGAVAFAWEFGKDPIAGVTPFSQMVKYVRSQDRRVAAEKKDGEVKDGAVVRSARLDALLDSDQALAFTAPVVAGPLAISGGGLAGMRPIVTPLAASGFTPRSIAFLGERLGPLGMAPMAGGAAQAAILKEHGDKPLAPGSPLSIAMVTGDFDLSGIGTVTHVEGDRVYGFGHPMYGLGPCEFPMMTGYIHTVYPRTSVSMKMGSPLKTVGVLDTDVSTAVAGRVGPKPDMLPMSVHVKTGRYAEPQTYNVQIVREPNLLPSLVMTILSNAIDTDGNLPEELTAHIQVDIVLKGQEPIKIRETLSGPRFTGPMGPMMLFGPVANIVNTLVRNSLSPVRIESIEGRIEIEPGRRLAEIESIRLASDRVEAGKDLMASITLKPFKGERQTLDVPITLPADLPDGPHELAVCDMNQSMRRRFRNEPSLLEPRDVEGLLKAVRLTATPKRTALYLHILLPDRGVAVHGQSLPSLPGSARAVLSSTRQTPQPPVRADLIQTKDTPWVVEGMQTIRFTVVKDVDVLK